MKQEKEYIIFCDESDKEGKYYSTFYGGLIVGASHYERVTAHLNTIKQEQNLYGEVKWEKVTQRYLQKYETLIRHFFQEVASKNIKVRIDGKPHIYTGVLSQIRPSTKPILRNVDRRGNKKSPLILP